MSTSRILNITLEGNTHALEIISDSNQCYRVVLEDRTIEADVLPLGDGSYSVISSGKHELIDIDRQDEEHYRIHIHGQTLSVRVQDPRRVTSAGHVNADEGPLVISTSMPGRVVRLLVQEGDEVEAGTGVIVIEAMKMQNELKVSRDGRVSAILVKEGQAVEAAEALLRIE